MQDLSIIFLMVLGIWICPSVLEESGKCCPQFSRKLRKKTMIFTYLSVSLQYLVKLWRWLFSDLLKNLWKAMQSLFVSGKSCLTNLISFYKKFLHLVDQVKTVDVICLNFTKTSDTVSQILSFLNKMSNL